MADRHAINQLFSEYAWAQDARDFVILNDVFTEDARFRLDITGDGTVGPFEGRAALVDFISSAISEQTDQRRHVITNVRFERETDHDATVTAILTLNVVEHGTLAVKSTGVYRTGVVLDGGAWRFRDMHLTLDLPY